MIIIHRNHKFAKVYSAKCILSSNSPKFATAKVSLYTVFENILDYDVYLHYVILWYKRAVVINLHNLNFSARILLCVRLGTIGTRGDLTEDAFFIVFLMAACELRIGASIIPGAVTEHLVYRYISSTQVSCSKQIQHICKPAERMRTYKDLYKSVIHACI